MTTHGSENFPPQRKIILPKLLVSGTNHGCEWDRGGNIERELKSNKRRNRK